jgi:hypothetical protein
MTTGFLIVLVITFIIIIGGTLWVTKKAYSRKPEQIDPLPQDALAQKDQEQ